MVTKEQVINYGGDALAFMTAIIALVGFLQAYMPPEYAGALLTVSLFLTRGSTLLSKLLEYLKTDTVPDEPITLTDEGQ